MTDWSYSSGAHRYRDPSSGRFLAPTTVLATRDDFLTRRANVIQDLADLMDRGDITVQKWEREDSTAPRVSLGEMTPRLAQFNTPHHSLRYTEAPRQIAFPFSGRQPTPNLSGLRLRQLRHAVSLPCFEGSGRQLRNTGAPSFGCAGHPISRTTLLSHVSKVVCLGSGPQMMGRHAGRIIATRTVVAGLHSRAKRTEMEFVREAMSIELATLGRELPVAKRVAATCPQPATVRVGLIHARPEGRYRVLGSHLVAADGRAEQSEMAVFPLVFIATEGTSAGSDRIGAHCEDSLRGATASVVDATRGHFSTCNSISLRDTNGI